MDAAHMQSELDRANAKLDRLEALREGAGERYAGEREKLEQQEISLEERKTSLVALLAASAQPGNDFVTRATSTRSTRNGGLWPERIIHWNGFLEEVTRFIFDQTERKFSRPQFVEGLRARVENSVETAMEVNIFHILNSPLSPKFEFSKQKDSDFNPDDPNIGLGKPDFTCREYDGPDDHTGKRIISIEIKRDCVLTQLHEISSSELFDEHSTGHAHGDLGNVIRQIYNYMVADELQYGILATYDYHWFFCRPSDNPSTLLISEALRLQSTNPPVLKTYAYLVRLATNNPKSPHPNVMPGRTRQDIRIQGSRIQNSGFYNQSFSQSLGSDSSYHNQQGSRDQSSGDQDSITGMEEQTYGYKDFKLEGILGCGQTGRTFRARFHGESIAMKVIDLYKEADLLHKIRKEIEIYKNLVKIQGIYIPKLVCHGYYGYGMGYFMGTTIVGTTLNKHK
ncbi:1127_t:CDS:2, partial [Ambispora gerdemannii]